MKALLIYIASLLSSECKYQQGIWTKSNTKNVELSEEMLMNLGVPFGEGRFKDDVIVTNFKGGEIIKSDYFLYSTLSDQSKVVEIIIGKPNE